MVAGIAGIFKRFLIDTGALMSPCTDQGGNNAMSPPL